MATVTVTFGFERAPGAEALNELANERIHRNHAFGFHLAERDMNGPFPRSPGMQAIVR